MVGRLVGRARRGVQVGRPSRIMRNDSVDGGADRTTWNVINDEIQMRRWLDGGSPNEGQLALELGIRLIIQIC